MRKIPRKEKGFSMVEVLISLLVMSIGLAGIAAMQLTTLQYVHSAHYRSMASTIALDFEERLWWEVANDNLTGCPDLDNSEGSALDNLLSHWERSYVGGDEEGDWDWSDAVMLRVPGLQISAGDAVSDGHVSEVPITLSWSDTRFSDLGENSTESFTYNVRIICRPAVASVGHA